MKKLYLILLVALFNTLIINAQNTIFTENFGGNFTHLESLSTNSSGYIHTGAGDFTHKIIIGQGALGSKCFGQLDSSGYSSASRDIQLFAGNTYEFKAYVKTIQSRLYVTLRINVGGTDVATSGITSANGVWEELSCTYTPSLDEMAILHFTKTQGQLANIDKIKVICTSCTDQNYVFDFNDSKESWIGAGPSLTLGNNSMNIIATGLSAVARSGNLQNGNLNLNTSNYDRARVTFRTPYAAGGAGAGKLYFYSLAGGNTATATFNITRDASNTTTFQTVEIDLSSTPVSGTFSGPIARLGFRAPWGISSGDTCFLQKIELYNQPPAVTSLTFTGIMDLTVPTGGSDGKAIQLTANQNISDLSLYSVNSFSNGNTSSGTAFTFPNINVLAGQHIILCRDSVDLATYFGSCWSIFDHVVQGNQPTGNGDDAYELYMSGNTIETYGVVGVDGTGESWEYLDSWAWKDTAASNVGNWVYGVVNCSDGSSSMQTSNCPYPLCGSAPPSSNNVTFSVNTSNITVGPNGMYAGGGVLGDAMAVQLSDPDGDGTWTGVAQINVGATGNYIFLNSPNNGGDWGAKENLAGQPCSDPANYDDRILPNITSDTVMLHCFGSCETDGSCPAPPSDFTVTFNVNTANITVGPNGMYAGGGMIGGSDALALSDPDGDGVWTGDTILPGTGAGNRNFAFFNSPTHGSDWGTKENISGLPCADAANFDDRNLPMFYSDTTLLYCFGACETDGSCPTPPTAVNVTFQVDMNQSVYANATPYLRGSWDWGGSGDMMSDSNGDNIWDFTKTFTGGSNEYIFAIDTNNSGSWDVNEVNDPNEPCTNGNAQYTNRVLVLPSADSVFGAVCLGSCSPCGPPPTTFYNVVFMVNTANITVGPNGMYAGGGALGDAMAISLVEIDTITGFPAPGSNIWVGADTLPSNITGNYIFLNSPNNGSDWAAKENLGGQPCADTNNFNDRILPPITANNTVLRHCFGSCETDGSCPTPPTAVNVTFQVDMNQSVYANATPYLRGSWNWGGPGDLMNDADGDNVWHLTFPLIGSSFEFIYAIDTAGSGAWDINETNDPNEPCTNGNTQYTNRVLNVPSSDSTLGVVCLGSCSACSPSTGLYSLTGAIINIYPNPANELVTILFSDDISLIEVRDIVGRVVYQSKDNSNKVTINTSSLSNNVYIVRCLINDKVVIKKFTINH